MDHKWFIQRCLIAVFWLITNFICGITGRPGATGNPRTPRAEGNVISEVCKSFLGLLGCSGLSCTGALLLMWKNVLFFKLLLPECGKKQFIFVESSKSNFRVHCSVTVALIMTASLLWRAWCESFSTREAGKGHLVDLWCQTAHPHHRDVFSSDYRNVSLRLYLFYSFFSPITQKKNWVVFLGSAIIAECSTPEP